MTSNLLVVAVFTGHFFVALFLVAILADFTRSEGREDGK